MLCIPVAGAVHTRVAADRRQGGEADAAGEAPREAGLRDGEEAQHQLHAAQLCQLLPEEWRTTPLPQVIPAKVNFTRAFKIVLSKHVHSISLCEKVESLVKTEHFLK